MQFSCKIYLAFVRAFLYKFGVERDDMCCSVNEGSLGLLKCIICVCKMLIWKLLNRFHESLYINVD